MKLSEGHFGIRNGSVMMVAVACNSKSGREINSVSSGFVMYRSVKTIRRPGGAPFTLSNDANRDESTNQQYMPSSRAMLSASQNLRPLRNGSSRKRSSSVQQPNQIVGWVPQSLEGSRKSRGVDLVKLFVVGLDD